MQGSFVMWRRDLFVLVVKLQPEATGTCKPVGWYAWCHIVMPLLCWNNDKEWDSS